MQRLNPFRVLNFTLSAILLLSGWTWAENCRLLVQFKSHTKPWVDSEGQLKMHFPSSSLSSSASGGSISLENFRFQHLIEYSTSEKLSMQLGMEMPLPAKYQKLHRQRFRNLMQIVRIASCDSMQQLALQFEKMPDVDFAQTESVTPPPPPTNLIAPTTPPASTPDLTQYQNYRDSLNFRWAWSQGAKGQGIKAADIEWDMDYDHEDLKSPRFIEALPSTQTSYRDHGTSVVGILFAQDNDFGMTGMVPDLDKMYGLSELPKGRTKAILQALDSLEAGDVLIYEMQAKSSNGQYVPADWDLSVWKATQTATDMGIIVVAAAGNGGQDLDGSLYQDYMRRGDNGAIIVGAGNYYDRTKAGFSTYGSRVNVHGWGGQVSSTDYSTSASFVYDGSKHRSYTRGFSGTSSATPIVASAVIAIQSWLKTNQKRILTPLEMRQLLIETGFPQKGSGHIGPLPNVKAAIEKMQSQNPISSQQTQSSSLLVSSSAYSSQVQISSSDANTVDCQNLLAWQAKSYQWSSSPECVVYMENKYCHNRWVDERSPDQNSDWNWIGVCGGIHGPSSMIELSSSLSVSSSENQISEPIISGMLQSSNVEASSTTSIVDLQGQNALAQIERGRLLIQANTPASISIFSVNGQLLYQQRVNVQKSIDLDFLGQQSCYVRVQVGHKSSTLQYSPAFE